MLFDCSTRSDLQGPLVLMFQSPLELWKMLDYSPLADVFYGLSRKFPDLKSAVERESFENSSSTTRRLDFYVLGEMVDFPALVWHGWKHDGMINHSFAIYNHGSLNDYELHKMFDVREGFYIDTFWVMSADNHDEGHGFIPSVPVPEYSPEPTRFT
jgi:hypothetical protein